MNLLEVTVFIALLWSSGFVSLWLGRQIGVPWPGLIVPVFLAEFYLLRTVYNGTIWLRVRRDPVHRHGYLGDEWVNKGQHARAVDEYTQALSAGPSPVVAVWRYLQRGVAYQHLGQRDRAIADLGEVIARDPGGDLAFIAHLDRGKLYLDQHEYDLAYADLTKAVVGLPESPQPRLHRAHVLEAQGRPRAALADLDRALSLPKPPAAAHYHKATLHEQLGEVDQALSAYRHFLRSAPRRDPNRPQARERVRQLVGR